MDGIYPLDLLIWPIVRAWVARGVLKHNFLQFLELLDKTDTHFVLDFLILFFAELTKFGSKL
jgi:hypothetical protein